MVRVGSFNLVSDGEYVGYDLGTGSINELARQPAARFVSSASDLASSSSGFVPFGLDPTRGQLLALQVQVPTIEERIQQAEHPAMSLLH